MNKWYMHSSESNLVNETHELIWDFEIQTDYLVSARWPDLVIINKQKEKKTCQIVNFAVPADHSEIKTAERKEKYLDFA